MPEYRIISRGRYAGRKNSIPVTVESYVIAENDEGRFIMLRFGNEKEASLSKISLTIVQYNRNGKRVGEINLDEDVGGRRGRFVLNKKIKSAKNCTSFSVEITVAEFSCYRYTMKDGAVSLDYIKTEPRVYYDTSAKASALGGKKCIASVRKLSSPIAIGVLSALLMACVIVFTCFHLNYFKNNAEGFQEGGVLYEFITDDNGEYAGVTVTGYTGLLENVTIPEEIGGYHVLSISTNAFTQSNIKSLTIEGDPEIEAYAFYACESLRSVSLGNVSQIGLYAFDGCISLENAVMGGDDVQTITISKYAFAGCTSLKSVSINSYTVYPSGGDIFERCPSLQNLSLYNLNTNSNDTYTIATLFNGDNYDALDSIYVFSLGYIGSSTFAGLNISSLTVGNLLSGEIPSSAFRNCYNLQTISLPVKITSVGEYAFNNCAVTTLDLSEVVTLGEFAFYGSGLTELDLSENNQLASIPNNCFAESKSLIAVSLPLYCTSIDTYAFYNCENLTSLTVDSYLRTIKNYAFYGCQALTSLNFSNTVTLISECAFANCSSLNELTFESGLSGAGACAFANCTSLTSIVTPENLSTISSGMFSGCTSLESVTFSSFVTAINDSAFSGCTALKNISFTDNITTVSDYAFRNCTGLTSVYIPSNLINIGTGIFSGCNSMVSVTLYSMPQTLGYYFGYNVPSSLKTVTVETGTLPSYAFSECSEISQVILPQSLTSISEYAFSGCTSITSISLPDTITVIGVSAFERCTGFTEFIMPERLRYIYENAFYGCGCLEYIELPSSLSYIYDNAFYNCYKLREVCNYSSLSLTAQSETYGMVAAYALIVYTDSTQKEDTLRTSYNGINLMYAGGEWYVISADSTSSISFDSLRYNGDSITSCKIASYAFIDATLTSVTIGTSITEIGSHAFYNCTNLSSVTFDNTIQKIYEYAFFGCSALTSLEVNSANSYLIGSYAFSGSGLKSVSLSGYLSSVGAYAFENCGSLITLTINSSSSYTIGDYAFSNTALTSVNFGGSLKSIGSYAFIYSTELASIDFPSTLNSIGSYAFMYCTTLSVVILRSSVTIDTEAFYGCSKLYEVYDITGMGVTTGSFSNGYVGYYALAVYNDINAERVVAVSGNFVFLKNGSWSLVKFTADASYNLITTPDNFASPAGTTITSYAITDYAFSGANVYGIVVSSSVSEIAAYAFTNSGYSIIYYCGNASEWSNISSATVTSILYYVSCVHESGYWTYNSSGSIVTNVSSQIVTVEAATCLKEGTANEVCNVCGAILFTSVIEKTTHQPDSTGLCTICGTQGEIITDTTVDSAYLDIINDTTNPYVYDSGVWQSINMSGTSEFTVTAKSDITIYLSLTCSAASTDCLYVIITSTDGTQITSYTLHGGQNAVYTIELKQGESLTVKFERNASTSGTNCAYINALVAYPSDEQ